MRLKALFLLALLIGSERLLAQDGAPRTKEGELSHSFSVGLKLVSANTAGNIWKNESHTGYGLHFGILPKIAAPEADGFELGLSLDLVSWDANTRKSASALFDSEVKTKVRISNLYWDVCSTRGLVVCLGLPLSNTAVIKQSGGDEGTEVTISASSFPVRLLALYTIGHWQLGLETSISSWTMRVQNQKAYSQIWSHAASLAFAI